MSFIFPFLSFWSQLEMPWPVVNDLWTRWSFRVPLPSDKVSHLNSFRDKQKEGNKSLYIFNKSVFWDLDFGFQTFGASSREEISRRIWIWGANFLLLSSSIENVGNRKSIKFGLGVITRHKELGFRRNIPEILPTSFPELPTQLRDIRNNQNPLNVYFLETINKYTKSL